MTFSTVTLENRNPLDDFFYDYAGKSQPYSTTGIKNSEVTMTPLFFLLPPSTLSFNWRRYHLSKQRHLHRLPLQNRQRRANRHQASSHQGILLSGNLAAMVVAGVVVAAASISGGYGAADAKIMVGLIGLWPQTVPFSLLAMLVFDLYWRKYKQGSYAPLVVAILGGVVLTLAGEFAVARI